MPRSTASAADQELTAQLAALSLTGSSARYERWRQAGLLPRHERRGAGRGRGSVSELARATVEIAAALARHTAQGRDLRAAVVAWFIEAGRPTPPDQAAIPEPPDTAVAEALEWAVHADPGYRMLQRARAASTEAQQDSFYEAAVALSHRGPSAELDPSAMREALLNGQDIPSPPRGSRSEVVHIVAAMGFGADEVGPEAFADALVATGLFPQGSAEEWRKAMTDAFNCESCADPLLTLTHFDPVKALNDADITQLRQAREVFLGLAGFGALLMMHALLMPDTPGLTALRDKISELGLAPSLINLARQLMRPERAAFGIVACLNPAYAAWHRTLYELAAAGPPLLHLAGDERHDPERYMETWISAIRELGKQNELPDSP